MKHFQPSESLAVGFLLALTGGLLDAYSYLNRGEVFATAETGNIVLNQSGPAELERRAALSAARAGLHRRHPGRRVGPPPL